jgi:SAM-dependent methyltransferase
MDEPSMGDGILEFYDRVLGRIPDHGRVVEVGVWLGRTAIHLAKRIQEDRRPVLVYAVDTFRGAPCVTPQMADFVQLSGGSILPQFKANVRAAGVENIVIPVERASPGAADEFADESVDLVFLDADHTYEGVKADLAAWYPKVKPGGLLAGHDLCGNYPGVWRALEETRWRYIEEGGSVWSLKKP